MAPVLDTTTELLADPTTDFSKVQVVCCDFEGEEDSEFEKTSAENSVKGHHSSHNLHSSLPNANNSTNSATRTKSRSRSRSKSIISMSLMNSIHGSTLVAPTPPTASMARPNRSAASLLGHAKGSEASDSSQTINFYSYADMVNQEQLSPGSEDLSNIDGRLDNDQIRRFEGYTFGNSPQPEYNPEEGSEPTGFTTVSMKEYMSGP